MADQMLILGPGALSEDQLLSLVDSIHNEDLAFSLAGKLLERDGDIEEKIKAVDQLTAVFVDLGRILRYRQDLFVGVKHE